MTEFGLMMEAGAACITDGRNTLRNAAVIRRAMTYARDFGALIACETQDADLAAGGMMNEGLLASWLGFSGIPKEAEIIPLERDVRLDRIPLPLLGDRPAWFYLVHHHLVEAFFGCCDDGFKSGFLQAIERVHRVKRFGRVANDDQDFFGHVSLVLSW